jgi:thioredoxin reductase (NADPH)
MKSAAESPIDAPPSPTLSASQLATLAGLGEERTAGVGDALYGVGDRSYPFIAIREGEVAILDAAGNEIVRHGASGFLGELNMLSGQTVFVTAVVTQPLRYIAVDRDVMRSLLYEDGPLGDIVLSAFMARREALQRVQGIDLEIVGPHSSNATMRMIDFARANRLPFTWRDPERADDQQARRPTRSCPRAAAAASSSPAAWAASGSIDQAAGERPPGTPHRRRCSSPPEPRTA